MLFSRHEQLSQKLFHLEASQVKDCVPEGSSKPLASAGKQCTSPRLVGQQLKLQSSTSLGPEIALASRFLLSIEKLPCSAQR